MHEWRLQILGLDARSEHTLKLFIAQKFGDTYDFVEENGTSLYLINMDDIAAPTHYKEVRRQGAIGSIILLSFKNVETQAGEYFLRKPLSVAELGSVLERLYQKEQDSSDGPHPLNANIANVGFSHALSDSNTKVRHNVASLVADKQIKTTIERRTEKMAGLGENKSLNAKTGKDRPDFFDTELYNLGEIQQAVAEARKSQRVIVLTSDWPLMTFFPKTNCVHIHINDRQLQSLCAVSLNKNRQKKGTQMKAIDFEDRDNGELNSKCPASMSYQDLDSFLWKIAMWTARGRAIKDTDLDSIFYFASWPNLTRLVCPRNTLPILAAWIATPQSLNSLASGLDVAIEDVLMIYAGGVSIGLVGKGQRIADSLIAPIETLPDNKNRQILSKILKKLKRLTN